MKPRRSVPGSAESSVFVCCGQKVLVAAPNAGLFVRPRAIASGPVIAPSTHWLIALEVVAQAAIDVQLAPNAAGRQAVEIAAAALAAVIAGLAEVGVGQEDLVALVVVEHAEDVELVLAEVAPAAGQGGAVVVLAAGLAAADARLEAAVVAPHDDVHHAGDGVRAVDRGGAVLQDLDPLDRAGGNGVQVDEGVLQVLSEAVAGDAAAVDQHQGRLLAQAAQRDAGGARSEAVGEAFAEAAAAVGRQIAEHFGNGRLAGALDVLAGDHVDRRDRLGVDPFDVRTGDFHPLHLLRLLLLGNGGDGDSAGTQCHDGQADLSLSKHHSLMRSLKLAACADEFSSCRSCTDERQSTGARSVRPSSRSDLHERVFHGHFGETQLGKPATRV